MKLRILSILLFSVLLVISCSDNAGVEIKAPTEISGVIEGGYRHLRIDVSSDSVELVVYRGDYVKFYIDDKGEDQVDYQLDIPELGVNAVIKDNTLEQPYFKMKTVGVYPFTVADLSGKIEVIELRQSNYRELKAEEAWEVTLDNPPLLLDVRTRGEYYQGHLENALLMPLQEIQARIGELDQYKNQPILIYCATGNRSTTASKILLDKGFKDVMNLRLGIMGWASKGYNIKF